jgi:hypothetical protein
MESYSNQKRLPWWQPCTLREPFGKHNPVTQLQNIYFHRCTWASFNIKKNFLTGVTHWKTQVNPLYQYLQNVFTPLDFFHILLCYRLNWKCIKLRFIVTGLHTITHHVKVELWHFFLRHFYKWITNQNMRCLESISI